MDVQKKALKQDLEKYGYELNVNVRPYLLYSKVDSHSFWRELVLCTNLYYDNGWVGVFKTLTDEGACNSLGCINNLNTIEMNRYIQKVSMGVDMKNYLYDRHIHKDFLDYRDYFKRKKIDYPSKEEVIKFFKNK